MSKQRFRQRGFTLIELMISATIGLLLVAGMTAMFVSNNGAQAEIDKANRQIENGRFSVQMMSDDLRNAAYYGEFDPTVLALPTTLPDPCSVALVDLRAALPVYVQGVDNAAAGAVSCLQDLRPGTDVLVVRHASTCTIDLSNCEVNSAGAPYFQASLCNNLSELGSGSSADFYALDSVIGNMTRHQRDCTETAGSGTLAVVRYMQIHIYFVANNDNPGDGIPTLKRIEIGNQVAGLALVVVPLVEGVENLQMEYGLDTNNDGAPDVYTANPTTYGGCAAANCAVANWGSVVAAKINLLARSNTISGGYTDSKSYVLGANADGSSNVIPAANDHYKRHVFQAAVVLSNPAGRRAP